MPSAHRSADCTGPAGSAAGPGSPSGPDAESAGWLDALQGVGSARGHYPGVAAHLLACGPCTDDFDGLLAAARERAGDAHA